MITAQSPAQAEVHVNQLRLVNDFIALSKIDGIHGNELAVAQELMARLKELGLHAVMDDAGATFGGNAGNIRAQLTGKRDVPPVLLCAHMDTIESTKNLHPVIEHDIIKSDGTTILGGDNRAGVAVILEILRMLTEKEIGHGPIEVLFTVAEEAGMHGAKHVKRSDIHAPFGFVFDCQASPGNYIVEAPGAVSFKAAVTGRSAHAAVSPEKGIHAIQIASKAIAQLRLGRWDQTGMLNIGTIHGGTAINVVPDQVVITGETRNANEEKLNAQIEYIRSTFQQAAADCGGAVEIQFTEKYGGYQFTDDSPMIAAARYGIQAVGLDPVPLKYAGGSDANVLNKNGIPVLNLGVGFKNAHSFQECLAIRDLVTIAEIGLRIVEYVAGKREREA